MFEQYLSCQDFEAKSIKKINIGSLGREFIILDISKLCTTSAKIIKRSLGSLLFLRSCDSFSFGHPAYLPLAVFTSLMKIDLDLSSIRIYFLLFYFDLWLRIWDAFKPIDFFL